jgi:hypothetical protein
MSAEQERNIKVCAICSIKKFMKSCCFFEVLFETQAVTPHELHYSED